VEVGLTQLEQARQSTITDVMRQVASEESIEVNTLCRRIAEGKVIIPANVRRKATRYCGVGQGLRTKVNANIGTSMDCASVENELQKLQAAVAAGADAVMDLSTGGDLRAIRRRLMDASPVTMGSVPIYEAAANAARKHHNIRKMTAADMFAAVRAHCEDGVDFITMHCGVTRDVVDCLRKRPRVCNIVSRGGTFLQTWMEHNRQENPFYERFDELVAMAREYDCTLSLGDGMRPGAQADACDPAQVAELRVLVELAQRAVAAGVQVMLEGPGHVPLAQVETQIRLQKEMSGGLPFYVLGPIVTDVAPGYDHITSAIGGAIAAGAGADFLCYVTPAEHLSLPGPADVHTGVIAARIAAHAGDIAKGVPGAAEWDRKLSQARAAQDWATQYALAIDPAHARQARSAVAAHSEDVCSMCGDYCVFKVRKDETIEPVK
jgi:phosphomethylpyrimidine synthase